MTALGAPAQLNAQAGSSLPPPVETPAAPAIQVTEDPGQTLLTFESLGYQTSTFSDGDSLLVSFDAPYQQSSATLNLNITTDATPTPLTTTLDLQVSSPDDDAYTSKHWAVLCDGERILRLGNHTVCGRCSVFARFPDLSGLHGTTITNAYLELYRNDSQGTASIIISAEDAQDPQPIFANWDHRTRPRTSTSIPWSGTLSGGWNRSPSITSIIQELVDKYNPSAFQLFLDDDNIAPTGNSWELITWEYGLHNRAIKLHVEYLASTPPPPPDSPQDSVDIFVNDAFITSLSLDSSLPPITIPSGIITEGPNTLSIQFAGPTPITLLNDSAIEVTEEMAGE